MKRRLTAVIMAFCMAISSAAFTYAAKGEGESTAQEEQETTTEETTEKETEPVTEAPTEAPTEATTVKPVETTEATTARPASDNNNREEVWDTFTVRVDVDDTERLSDYLPASAPDASDFDWDTSNSSIAYVNSSGRLTANRRGSCTITAEATEGNTEYRYTFEVTVRGDSTEDITIEVGETEDLYDYVDDDYDARDYEWESSNERYVTVSSRGVATGEREGSARVTATYDDGDEEIEYEFKITVEDEDSRYDDDDDDEVEIKTSWDIYVGTDDDVDVSDLLEDYADEYDWSVDDYDIADVDDDGVITGLEEGETTVRAEGDRDYRFDVYVGDDYSNDEISIRGEESEDLEDYLDDDVDYYSFESDRRDVVRVSSSGVVTGVANGVATVICENMDDDSIIQIFVTVSGISHTTTTRETTTEATTREVVTQTTTVNVTFNDISHRPWANAAIMAMASKGYIVGVGDNKFSPDANCKRCDFAIVLAKMLNLDGSDVNAEYDDISSRAYYYDYVMALLGNNIEAGVANNAFRPDEYVTREEVMTMVYEGLVNAGISMNTDTSVLSKYTDASSINGEYRTAVAALINSGAISGTSDTTLEPKANITRAQMAVIMNNVDQTVN